MIKSLPATHPFKYLGCRTTLDLSWKHECAAVLGKMDEVITRIRFGVLPPSETRQIIEMGVVLVFLYTASIAAVDQRTTNEVTKLWWRVHLAAIELPQSVSRTLLRVPHCRGGWQITHAR
eukprot:1418506-Rhodomonas_salina.1